MGGLNEGATVMSIYFMTFSVPVDCHAFDGVPLTLESVADFLSPTDYQTSSRNGLYQITLESVLRAYEDFQELRYLCVHRDHGFALVRHDDLSKAISAIYRLFAAISENPVPFVEFIKWYGAATAEDVRRFIVEAKVLRDISDDCGDALGNFFSFLLSQAAVLQEAKDRGLCLLHVTVWG